MRCCKGEIDSVALNDWNADCSYQGAENYNGQTPILKRSTVDTLWHCLLVGPRYALGFQRHFLIRPAKDEAAQAATLKSGSGGIW